MILEAKILGKIHLHNKKKFSPEKRKDGNLPEWFLRALSRFFSPSIGKVKGMMINVTSILSRIVIYI